MGQKSRRKRERQEASKEPHMIFDEMAFPDITMNKAKLAKCIATASSSLGNIDTLVKIVYKNWRFDGTLV